MKPEDHEQLQQIGERRCSRCLQDWAAHMVGRDGRRSYGVCTDFTTDADVVQELAEPFQYPSDAVAYLAGKWWTPHGIADTPDGQ